jgi:predicted dehydrogenase
LSRLRLGVIGAGSWANVAHLPALASRPEVEFVGVSRMGAEQLRAVQNRYGFEFASEDYRDIVNLGLDICVVASPAALHMEHASAALRAGAHVLCEKPMTIGPEQGWSLVDIAADSQRQLLVSFGWNYMPMVRRAVELVRTSDVGALEHITIHMSSSTRELLCNTGAYPGASPETVPESATWTDPLLSGGGYGQAQLSHAFALALALTDERVTAAAAFTSAPGGAPVELHDGAALRFAGGGIGVISGGSSHLGASGNKHELEVRGICSRGQFIVDVHRELVWVFTADGKETTLELEPGAGAYDFFGPANALVDVALGKLEKNAAPGELGARTVEALDLVYRSARDGVVVTA